MWGVLTLDFGKKSLRSYPFWLCTLTEIPLWLISAIGVPFILQLVQILPGVFCCSLVINKLCCGYWSSSLRVIGCVSDVAFSLSTSATLRVGGFLSCFYIRVLWRSLLITGLSTQLRSIVATVGLFLTFSDLLAAMKFFFFACFWDGIFCLPLSSRASYEGGGASRSPIKLEPLA